MDKTSVIFGNQIDKKTIKKAAKSKAKYQKKFGDDSKKDYKLGFETIPTLDFLGAKNIVFKESNEPFLRMESSSETSGWASAIIGSALPWRAARKL